MPGSNLRLLSPIKKLSGPQLPAQVDLNYWFRTSDDAFILTYMKDRSANGVANPSLAVPTGQRGRMIYADLAAASIVPSAINDKTAILIGGQTRLNVSLQRDTSVYQPYFDPATPFTTMTICKGTTLSATNNFIIFVEITGTPNIFGNVALYVIHYSPSNIKIMLASEPFGIVGWEAPITVTATTFNSYSTILWSYNGLGLSPGNFSIRVNGSAPVAFTASANTTQTGNGGVFFGTGNDISIPTAFFLEGTMWNKELSAGELTELNDYTMDQYGLSS